MNILCTMALSMKAWRAGALFALLLAAALLLLPAVAQAQTPPETPASVTLTRADGTLSASWDAVSGATKHHITYSSDGGNSWTAAADSHAGSSITISGVDNAKAYVVAVRAGNDSGQWSGWRNSDSIAPLNPPPSAPSAVSVSRADGALTVSGYAVSGATKYHITYTSDGGQNWTAASDNHSGSSITISGVNNDDTYIVGVRAGNAYGWSGWRNSASSGPYTPPNTLQPGIAVQDFDGNDLTTLSVPEGGEASYRVKLTAPPNYNVKVCIGLSVRDKNDPDITFKGASKGVVALNLNFTPDNWNTFQTVTLVAAEDSDYANGQRDVGHDTRDYVHYWPGAITMTVTEIDNDTPPPAPSAPSGVTVTRADGTLTASGYAVNGATKYHITYSSDNMQSWTAASDNHTGSSITISGADNSKTYYIGVRAGNAGGWSGWTNSAAAGPLLATPTNLSVTPGDGYMDIAWGAVSDATGYDIRAKINNSASWSSIATGVTTNSYRYTTSNVVNKLAVRATNASGNSAWSELSRGPNDSWLTTLQQSGASAQSAQGQSQLAAPASIMVTRDNNLRDEKLRVSWAAVSGATGYNLACAGSPPDNTPFSSLAWWHCGSVTSGSTTSFIVDEGQTSGLDLVRTRSYTVAVRAVTGTPAQASPWVLADALPVRTPANISVSRAAGSVSVSWTRSGFSQGYEIECATFENNVTSAYTLCADVETQTVVNGTITATISSWTAGGTNYTIDDTKAYDLAIRATNASGNSPWVLAPLIYPNPTLTVSNISATAATLTIAHHTGNWYYKYTSPSGGTCSTNAVTGASTTVTLTADTAYTFAAYSDSSCGTLLATAAGFSTSASVSTLTSSVTGNSNLHSDRQQAVAFTTGSAASGYVLKSITAKLKRPTQRDASITMTLHAMEGAGTYGQTSAPSATVLATLSGSAPTTNSWTDTVWTCSGSGCNLDASTTYFVVATTTESTPAFHWAYATTETQTQQPSGAGWDLGFGHYKESRQGSTWQSFGDHNIAAIFFATRPSLTSSSVTATGAMLTIANHAGDWYYKYTSPSGGTCSTNAVSGATTTVTLSAGTTYTFAAYSDSSCSTLLATAAAFTTLSSASNLTSTKSGEAYVHSELKQAVAFTTGSNAGGYALKSVTVPLKKTGTRNDMPLTLTLHALEGTGQYSSSSEPSSTVLATLAGTAPTSSSWTNTTFTCSGSGCNLSARTTYFVVAASTEGYPALSWAYAATETETLQPSNNGWSVGHDHRKQSSNDNWASHGQYNIASLTFATKPSLTSSNVTATGATLTIANHTGGWWYKGGKLSGTDGACTSVASGTSTATLSGLEADTQYDYKAYSKANCASADLIATARFATQASGSGPTFSVTNVTSSAATLTLHNRTGSWWYKGGNRSGGEGSCTAGPSNFVLSLSALEATTEYTYRAYSDSSCGTQIATATFRTQN